MNLPKIAVFPFEEFVLRRKMLQALGELYDVEFVPTDEANLRAHGIAWLFGVARQEAVSLAEMGIRCLAFIAGRAVPVHVSSARVELADVSSIARCFRGRSLEDAALKKAQRLEAIRDEKVVMRKGEDILWIRRMG